MRPAFITAMRSDITSASPWSCVTNTVVMPRRRCSRSEEHTSELQSQSNLVCRLLLEKKKAYARPEPNETNQVDSAAEVYLITLQPERALEKHAHVLKSAPSVSNAHFGRAWAFGGLGQLDPPMAEMDLAAKVLTAQRAPTIDTDAMSRFFF